jgi:predicted protein tyrosine phosphatase
MIHVCSLARLHGTVEQYGARHVVTLMKDVSLVTRPPGVQTQDHLLIDIDDIVAPAEGYVAPAEQHVARLLAFVGAWDRGTPLVVHCYAGISRSTAAAFAAACALNPRRSEAAIAQEIRQASRTATPNSLIVSLADRLLGRNGRMISAIETIGRGEAAYEGVPFQLALE